MKKITLKKSILVGIGILSSLMLLVLMSSKYIYRLLLGVPTYETGFTSLDFDSVLLQELDWNFGNFLMSISSYISLGLAICGIIILVIDFFVIEEKGAIKASLLFNIFNVIASVIYMAVGIILVVVINKYIKESYEAIGGVIDDSIIKSMLFKTNAFVPLIVETILFVAFLVCKKLIPEKKNKVLPKAGDAVKPQIVQKSIAEKEALVVNLITKYNEIYQKSIISVMDFEKKKYILMFENDKVNLDDEEILIDVLVKYHKLYNEQIINRDEFEKKKLKLLF